MKFQVALKTLVKQVDERRNWIITRSRTEGETRVGWIGTVISAYISRQATSFPFSLVCLIMIFSLELFCINVICIIESEKNLINMLNIMMIEAWKCAAAVNPTQFGGISNYHIAEHYPNPREFPHRFVLKMVKIIISNLIQFPASLRNFQE